MGHEDFAFENRERLERKDWGVALGVPMECEREAFRIRDAIEGAGVELGVALEHSPHITLFQGEFTSDSLQAIKRAVGDVLDGFFRGNARQKLVLEMEDSLCLRQGNNNVFWNAKKTDWLMELHLALDDRLRSLPEWGMMKQFRDRIEQGKLTPVEFDHVQKYGVVSAGDLFLPHITIGKLKDAADFERIRNIPIQAMSFPAEQIITGMIDRYGRIESVKATSDLKSI